jgi:hypothetical protein
MVKPVLLVAGAIPVILAIIIVIPLVTTPEIPSSAIDPSDKSEIELQRII